MTIASVVAICVTTIAVLGYGIGFKELFNGIREYLQ